jgi:hypothetical protein
MVTSAGPSVVRLSPQASDEVAGGSLDIMHDALTERTVAAFNVQGQMAHGVQCRVQSEQNQAAGGDDPPRVLQSVAD